MDERKLRVAIVGAGGRMGASLLHAANTQSQIEIVAAVVSAASPIVGQPIGPDALARVTFSSDLPLALSRCDVAIDFSSAAAVAANVAVYRKAGKALLVGTTGIAANVERELLDLGGTAAVMIAPNTSIGVTVLLGLVRLAAKQLPTDFDIEIFEAHHRRKRDSPSGTALALGAAAAAGRGVALNQAKALRGPDEPRQEGQIGIASIRLGDVVGSHSVWLAASGERLTLSHEASDRAVFARGALQAAAWLARQAAGSYTMQDFIGL
jgi:4-hydroxy-tetrahydrodipicolinate reductase